MLTQLLPDQISTFWDVIKYAVEQSLPPIAGDHPDKMNRILSSLLSSKSQCWASYTRDSEDVKFEGIVITKILYDDVSNTKNLLIYCLYGYEDVTKESWVKGLTSLLKFADSRGCVRVMAYTDIPYMIELAKQMKGEAKYTFISFDTKKYVKILNDLEEN